MSSCGGLAIQVDKISDFLYHVLKAHGVLSKI